MLNSRTLFKASASSFAFAFALSGAAQAQNVSTAAEFSAYLQSLTQVATPLKNVYLPGVNHAVVAPSGVGYASLTVMNPRDGVAGSGWDASTSFGLGFGNANDSIGVSLQANITGTQPFGTDGDFSMKFSRAVGDSTYVGLGINRIAGWGVNSSIAVNAEVMVTHFSEFGSGANAVPLMITAGISSAGSLDQRDPGAFFGVGFGLTEDLGMGVSVKNSALNAGFGYNLRSVDGLSLTADVSNITEVNTSSRIFSLGVHYQFDNLF